MDPTPVHPSVTMSELRLGSIRSEPDDRWRKHLVAVTRLSADDQYSAINADRAGGGGKSQHGHQAYAAGQSPGACLGISAARFNIIVLSLSNFVSCVAVGSAGFQNRGSGGVAVMEQSASGFSASRRPAEPLTTTCVKRYPSKRFGDVNFVSRPPGLHRAKSG